MDSLYLILLALFLLVIIPQITRRRRLAAIRHILNQKMQNKENGVMKELAKRFIGEDSQRLLFVIFYRTPFCLFLCKYCCFSLSMTFEKNDCSFIPIHIQYRAKIQKCS